jgi:TfoX/Sxy family transcriptional regulator of competence genes
VVDELMLERIRKALAPRAFTEQKMFGGVCFMTDGNMLAGISNRGLLVRVGKDAHAAAVAQPHARPMEMRGRPMEGYVFVDPAGTASEKELEAWLKRALKFVETLPPKTSGKTAKAAAKRKRAAK